MANEITCPYYNNRTIIATLTDPDAAALNLTGAAVYFSVREDHEAAAYTQLDSCDAVWTDGSGGDVAVTIDTADKQEGNSSVLLTVADTAGVELLAYKSITSVDLSGFSSIHVWLKSSVNCDAGDLQFLLDNTAACASPWKTIDIPALVANTWKRCVCFFDTTYHHAETSMPGIISIGIKQAVDKGAFTLRVDDVDAAEYLLEKVTGSIGADPTLGIATFNLLAEHTEELEAGEWDYDVDCYWSGTGVRYSPVIDSFEVLDHASVKD